MLDALKVELGRLQEDMLYTEKAHFAAADRAHLTHYVLGGTAALASGAAAATIVGDASTVLAGVLALVATLAATLVTFLKPEETAQQHLASGRDLGAVRVEARQLADLDAVPGANIQDLRARVEAISLKKASVDRVAPPISNSAFARARKKIDGGDYEHS